MKKVPISSTVALDRQYVWHPFTPFDSWLSPNFEMLSIVKAKGAYLYDERGRAYLDGNSSIWTNIHGHRCASIDSAIKKQLSKVAHTSFLGLTNELAPKLAQRLIHHANRGENKNFSRVIFSDDGSTAIEAAVKVAFQSRQLKGRKRLKEFVCLGGGYHGDTVGAMSVGNSSVFHGAYGPLLFSTRHSMSPYCYRCPYNKAKPQEADARHYRKCQWECVRDFSKTIKKSSSRLVAVVMEPLVQGAAGMIMHPQGYLRQVAEITKKAEAYLILDEVMTGFYRTGTLFAHFQEEVNPDAIALAKGLTGGYLPLAATLVSEEMVSPFYGGIDRTFYHGHSYTGNQLGCAASMANLDLLEKKAFHVNLGKRIAEMGKLSQRFWSHPNVGDVRQCGLILAIELVEERRTRKAFSPAKRMGWQVCEAARGEGLLARPCGNALLLMPRLNVTRQELELMVGALESALHKTLPVRTGKRQA